MHAQVKPVTDDVARKARALYARSHQGALATISQEIAGHPFGSVVTFAPDAQGRPLLLISTIAEHTRNIIADPRVSLLLTEGSDNAQEHGRLTLVGTARRLGGAEEAAAESRYYARFPHAHEYSRAHDFDLYVIEPLRVRYIGGFGRIHWIETGALCRANPFHGAAEDRMTGHMNADHAAALSDYCRLYGVAVNGEAPRLTAIDTEGFDVMLGKKLLRIEFDAAVTTPDDVRKAMVALSLRARELSARA